jgi:hypothetical protein
MEMAGLRHRSDLLLEEEGDDLFGGDEEAGDDEAGEDAADEGGDEEEADTTGEESEEPTEEEVPDKLSAKEVADLGPGEIDTELNDVMADIFADSTKSLKAKIQSENIHHQCLSSLLFEEVDLDAFDMSRFASETARMINHYDTLLDVEGMLFNKAKETLLQQFGDNGASAVTDFEEHMHRVHGIDLTDKFEEDIVQPIAVGAGSEGAV